MPAHALAHCRVVIDGAPVSVLLGTSVAAALEAAHVADGQRGIARISVRGEPRAPLCGMGICQECRVDIDGVRRLACQTLCAEGMQVRTR